MFDTVVIRPGMVGNTRGHIHVTPGSSKSTASDFDLDREFAESMQRLIREEPYAVMTHEDLEQQIRRYEQQYGFNSEQMLRMVESNTAPEDYEIMDWRILIGHR